MTRFSWLASLLLLGCSGGSSIGLEVDGVDDRSGTAGYSPSSPGARLMAVEVTLLNATDGTIPLTPGAFFLEPSSGTSLLGHPLTAAQPDACGGALAPGRTTTCAVTFDAPAGFEPVQIAFEHEDERATAPLSFTSDAGSPPDPDGGGPEPDAGHDGGAPPPAARQVDVLLMVDNSNSMTEAQVSFTAELPYLTRVLATGDFDQDGSSTGPDDFSPLDINLGVVTSDMGTGGHTVPTCARSDFGDDGVLRTQGRTDLAGCMARYPRFLDFRPSGGASADDFARDASCVAITGTGGCGFEQPLESILKALSPSAPTSGTRGDYLAPVFFRNTFGHGDTNNDGFVRDASVLVVIALTDENDCSARDPELFNPSSATYGATDLNLRCFAHEDAALHPISRFVDGLLQLRRHPSRLVFAPIAGVPVDLEPRAGERPNWSALTSPDPAARDDRLEERVDPAMPSRLIPSCNIPGRGTAFPPIRILRVAEQLERAGAGVAIGSLCQESFRGAFTEVLRHVRDSARDD